MEIRGATTDDVEAIRRVATAAWHEAHAPIAGADAVDEFLEEYYEHDRLREYVTNPVRRLFVAEDEEEAVVGFALVTAVDEEPGLFALGSIYVDPERWGEGIGTALLDRAERAAREHDGTRLRLGVMAENDRAIEFYEGRGYERMDEDWDQRLDVANYTYVKDL